MSLPKKRKKLFESQSPGNGIHGGKKRDVAPEQSLQHAPARAAQMERAFEIVDHIEHVHGSPDRPNTRSGAVQTDHPALSDLKGIRLRVSLGSEARDEHGLQDGSKDTAPPVIEVKIPIPSFFWKVPVLGGAARSLIRKLSKKQA
ncbi:MAG TPA: hypothetical protein PLT09_02755 [Deltaproteobacteria bacterium]|nr:hypothetical protein [Deltaproteobacteria bacterium]HPR54997.1 hypothetical protein [Deltaproteobacteria bacterium]HXK46334.1 hypothetical protein [Deltaproteobacteria bacterium]